MTAVSSSGGGVFDTLCDELENVLRSSARAELVAEAAAAGTFERALDGLRSSMRAHMWRAASGLVDWQRAIHRLDRKTRQIGFHVLNDWDGIADRVNDDIIPVDVLNYLIERRGSEPVRARTLAILLDYYFMHLLGLLSVRIWDDGDADVNLGRVEQLLRDLQGEHGSGQRFAADAETLLLIATSHYEMYERGYAVLLEQVRTLNRAHRVGVALGHAASMGCHLRFGFEATYARDTINMRDDNVTDYPWLLFALATLMDEFTRTLDGDAESLGSDVLSEALINGLSGDARAFIGKPPSSLGHVAAERAGFRDAFYAHRARLLDRFERYRPTEQTYSPLSFFFNFSHNVVKGTAIDAMLEGRPWALSLNDLLSSGERGASSDDKTRLARILMEYAQANPHTIRGRLTPVIVYDVRAGRQAFSVAMNKLREN